MNHIEKIRADIQKDFNLHTFTKGESLISVSPTKNFRLVATNYWSNEPNSDLTKVELFSELTNKKLFDFFTNYGELFYNWLNKEDTEYFICAEDLYGGQTIVNLTDEKMESYSPNNDGFIWTDFHLSPDGKALATTGCFWACPYVIKLYDFTDPMKLPLRELNQVELIGNDEIITGWLDNETITTKGLSRKYEKTINGDFTGKVLSEAPIVRLIKTNGTQQ